MTKIINTQDAIDEMEQIASDMDNMYDGILLREHSSIQDYGHAVANIVERFTELADYVEITPYEAITTLAGERVSTAILQAQLLDDAEIGICGIWWDDYPDYLCRTQDQLSAYYDIALANAHCRDIRRNRLERTDRPTYRASENKIHDGIGR